MPWICPYNNLDLDQRSILDNLLKADRTQWLRGFAGSGKSVILIHALGQLLAINPNTTACVIGYTHSLNDMLRSGLPDNAAHIRVLTYLEFCKRPFHCDYIFVDEVQDIDPGSLRILKDHARVLLVAGDEEQSIYPDKAAPGDIERCLAPQTHLLTMVYRLTEKLKLIVATIIPGARIQTARSARLLGNFSITLAHADSQKKEFEWVWNEALRHTKTGDPVAILFPGHDPIQDFMRSVCEITGIPSPAFSFNRYGGHDYGPVNQYFEARGLGLRYLGSGHGTLAESEQRRIVYLMTYHSAKGLDFETVFLPALNGGRPLYPRDPELEPRLFYVATTRSRRLLNLSFSSPEPHSLVRRMPMNLIDRIEIGQQAQGSGDADDLSNLF